VSDFAFSLQARSGRARAGSLATPHGQILTPVFAPVGTQASVKAVSPDQLEALGASLVLANTYHLHLRPGAERVAELGGLHAFMAWPHPLLTDSGGFQVFSLAEARRVDDDGVTFRSHLDGSPQRLTPESAMSIQELLGADIVMAFDECASPYDRPRIEDAMVRTHAWAERCRSAWSRKDQALFGIVQGGVFPDLRLESARFIADLDLPGIAIGGLSVGETKDEMHSILEILDPALPEDRPRYLMGVGSPEDLVEGVLRGIDIFDCVLPTRLARNHAALTRLGRLHLRKAEFTADPRPIDAACDCYACLHFSRAYLRHLIIAREMLASTLISIHNLRTLVRLMADLRQSILDGEAEEFAAQFRTAYRKHRPSEA
jgi:queuine tRNA-ribosyltransferase